MYTLAAQKHLLTASHMLAFVMAAVLASPPSSLQHLAAATTCRCCQLEDQVRHLTLCSKQTSFLG